jgi:hypothetical protein
MLTSHCVPSPPASSNAGLFFRNLTRSRGRNQQQGTTTPVFGRTPNRLYEHATLHPDADAFTIRRSLCGPRIAGSRATSFCNFGRAGAALPVRRIFLE